MGAGELPGGLRSRRPGEPKASGQGTVSHLPQQGLFSGHPTASSEPRLKGEACQVAWKKPLERAAITHRKPRMPVLEPRLPGWPLLDQH